MISYSSSCTPRSAPKCLDKVLRGPGSCAGLCIEAKGGAHVRARDHRTRRCCVPHHVISSACVAGRCSLCSLMRAFARACNARSTCTLGTLGTLVRGQEHRLSRSLSLPPSLPPSLSLSLSLSRTFSLSRARAHTHPDWRRGHDSAPHNHWRLFPAGPPRQVSCACASNLNLKPCRGSPTGVRRGPTWLAR